MLYINNSPYPDGVASLVPAVLGDLPEDVLILSLPLCDHAALLPLLDAEIVDEQERTISRYRPSICYEIADMDDRTYAKLRLSNMTTGDNPATYKAQAIAAAQQYTDAELSRIAAEQTLTETELQLLEVST